jgi:hypothetical protein
MYNGFIGFKAVSTVSILGGKLISLKYAIPYEIIHQTLATILKQFNKKVSDE